MPKKIIKKALDEILEIPKGTAKQVGQEVGVVPSEKPAEKPTLSPEELEEKKKKEQAFAAQRAQKLEAEIAALVEERKRKEAMARETPPEEEPEKPLQEPETKKPRQFVAGLKRRQDKSRAELAGRRTSG